MNDKIDDVISIYNEIASTYAKKISKRIKRKEIEQFASFLKQHSKILDLACAAGRDSRYFKDKKFDVVGVDLSENLLKIAKQENPDIQFLLSDMRHLPFNDNYFDGIWANAIFHHLDRKEMLHTLFEWKRILKDRGIMYLRTKMGKGLWKGVDELSNGKVREFTLLTKNELSEMIKKAGFIEITLEIQKDFTRNIHWLSGFYRK